MFGISSVIKNDKTSVFNEDTSPRQRLVDQWPAIYSWSIYIFDNFIEGLPRGDSNRILASKCLSLALHQLSHVQPVWEQMVESRQVVEIATRLWLEGDTDRVHTGACLLQSILPDEAPSEPVSRVIRTTLCYADFPSGSLSFAHHRRHSPSNGLSWTLPTVFRKRRF